jgi:DNA-binding response OmpR family regulator
MFDPAMAGPGMTRARMDANALPRVLLVEDDNPAAETFLEFLKGRPVATERVDTGAAVLACLDAAPPTVLLLDLGLPDTNGREILRHVVDQG